MKDLALDLDTGDISIANGRLSLTEGSGAARQRLQIRLRLFRGEAVLDQRTGIPYFDFLGRKNVRRRFEEMLRRAIVTSPGIRTLDAFLMEVDAERNAYVTFDATAIDGEPVTLNEFQVGAL